MGNNQHKESTQTVEQDTEEATTTKRKQVTFQEINNTSFFGKSFLSLTSQTSTYSVSRPWSRVSRKRWKESTLTTPYDSSKTAWPVSQLEAYFLPVFPVDSTLQERKYKVLEEYACGAFGKVYKVFGIEDRKLYALKVLSKSKIIKENAVQQVKEEVQIQSACGHHTFIVNSPCHWQTRKKLYIVSEFISGGELHNLLELYGVLPSVLVKLYVAQLALAIDFLHNAGIIYRDLKPENVLLDLGAHLKLVDFGLSKWLSYGKKTKTFCGTPRYMVFELTMEGRQVDEAVASIFHTLLFHRSTGKFSYTPEGNYSVGTVGYTDVDCDFIDLTYVRCTSSLLDNFIRREISGFSEMLRGSEGSGGPGMGQVTLEFFQKRPNRWLFPQECIPWEVWTIRLELITVSTEDDRQIWREKVSDHLTDKILYITEVVNQHDFIPKIPNRSELELVFDTSFPDVQPYLFKLNYSIAGPSASSSVGSTMKKLIRETLSL